jgi:DNA-binding transcriptional MerR regulator
MAVTNLQPDRRVEKSAHAFRTISEVATELDVPQHVLRFWESKFTQVRPLKRGGGRRYYRPEDIDLLRRIRSLLYEDGYTIKGVQRLLRESRGRLSLLGGRPADAEPRYGALESEAGGLPKMGPQPTATPPRASRIDLAKRREIESVIDDLQQALVQLRQQLQTPEAEKA